MVDEEDNEEDKRKNGHQHSVVCLNHSNVTAEY